MLQVLWWCMFCKEIFLKKWAVLERQQFNKQDSWAAGGDDGGDDNSDDDDDEFSPEKRKKSKIALRSGDSGDFELGDLTSAIDVVDGNTRVIGEGKLGKLKTRVIDDDIENLMSTKDVKESMTEMTQMQTFMY